MVQKALIIINLVIHVHPPVKYVNLLMFTNLSHLVVEARLYVCGVYFLNRHYPRVVCSCEYT